MSKTLPLRVWTVTQRNDLQIKCFVFAAHQLVSRTLMYTVTDVELWGTLPIPCCLRACSMQTWPATHAMEESPLGSDNATDIKLHT